MLVLLPNGCVAFMYKQGYPPCIDVGEYPRASFLPSGLFLEDEEQEVEYAYRVAYNYKEDSLLLKWLKNQRL
jgi:hypothetical protein